MSPPVVGELADSASVAVDAQGDSVAVWLSSDGNVTSIDASVRSASTGVWQLPVILSASGDGVRSPSVAVDAAGDAVVVWSQSDDSGQTYFVETDVGSIGTGTWQGEAPVQLSAGGANMASPQVAVNATGAAVVVWDDTTGQFVQGAQGSATTDVWDAAVDVSPTNLDSSSASVAIDALGDAVAVWSSFNGTNDYIQGAVKLAGSVSWPTTPSDVSSSGEEADVPQVAVDAQGDAVAVWSGSASAGHYVAQAAIESATTGSWQAPTTLGTSTSNVQDAQVAVNAHGDAVADWVADDVNNHPILQATVGSAASGVWQAASDLSTGSESAGVGSVAVDPQGDALVSWVDSSVIQTSSYAAGGGSWQPALPISTAGQTSGDPVTGFDANGDAVTVWLNGQFDGSTEAYVQAATYTAPAPVTTTTTSSSTSTAASVTTTAATASTTAGVPAPSSVAFTFAPDTDPLLSRQPVTFSITHPVPGATYQWDFGDQDQTPGSASSPFVVQALSGAAVTHTYADPPPPAAAAAAADFPCPAGDTGCTGVTSRFAVYVVRVRALNAAGTLIYSQPQNVVVVPVQPPTASFQVLRSQQVVDADGTELPEAGTTTAVTHPVTIVPQAQLPEVDSGAQDAIVREDFWFDGQGASGPPDLTCLSDGFCGQYRGSALIPSVGQLSPIAGQQDLGTGPLTQYGTPIASNPLCVGAGTLTRSPLSPARAANVNCVAPSGPTPTDGFPSFSLNFWSAGLGAIGSSASPIRTLPQEAHLYGVTAQPALTTGYPALTGVNLRDADGQYGEQGTGDCYVVSSYGGGGDGNGGNCTGDCFAGYPGAGSPFAFPGCAQSAFAADPATVSGDFFPVDREDEGLYGGSESYEQELYNARFRLEDEWNFLYNYATVAGVDTPLDYPTGPAIGARRSGSSTVPRSITMVAYDAEGVASAPATQPVPLTPASNPTVHLSFCDLTRGSQCVPVATGAKAQPLPVTAGDTLQFQTTGSSGGDDKILYYATAVGQPNSAQDCSSSKLTPSPPSGQPVSSTGTPSSSSSGSTGPKQKPSLDGARLAASTSTSFAAPPFPIPAFSDLTAGVFPFHNCDLYAARTVNANAAPGALPSSGPDQIDHVVGQASQAHAAVSGACATSANVADPIAITEDPSGVCATFPTAGTYSVAVAAYNTSGLGAITRVDGFEALPKGKSGGCQAVNSYPITIDDPNDAHAKTTTLGFSGKCVTVVTVASGQDVSGTGASVLFASTTTIDLDGVPVTPPPGYSIVIVPDGSLGKGAKGSATGPTSDGHAQIYVEKATSAGCAIPAADEALTQGQFPGVFNHKSLCLPASSNAAGSLYLAIGASSTPAAPGIAYEPHFTWKQARHIFGALPATGAPKIQGCGLAPETGSQPWANAGKSITPHVSVQFQDFDVPGRPCVRIGPKFSSSIDFLDDLPQGFQQTSAKSATAAVHMEGEDVPPVSELVTSVYANVARQHAQRLIDGTGLTLSTQRDPRSAHAAETEGFPDLPSCPATPSPSNLSIPQDTDLGPIAMPVGAQFCYVQQTGDFIGSVSVQIPGPLPVDGVKVGFEIGHGSLIQAGGEISGNIPAGPILINDLKFDVQTDPAVVAGAIEASIGDVLGVEAATIVKTDPGDFDLQGSVSIPVGGLTLPSFELNFGAKDATLAVSFGKDFGSASLQVSVHGTLNYSPFAFYMLGDGHACLFICLDVKGLMSNDGLAACGSVNLLFVTVSAGVAVQWKGPNSGVHLFTGCDLTPYIPAVFQNMNGPLQPGEHTARAGPDAHQSTTIPTLSAGATEPLTLNSGSLCGPSDSSGCSKGVVAVEVHSLASTAGVGVTPSVTLTGPAGDPRVIHTPSVPGQYSFIPQQLMSSSAGGPPTGQADEGSALVDQNPVPVYDLVSGSSAYCADDTGTAASVPSSCPKVTTTTLLIADPGTGAWTLSVEPGSAPVVDVAVAGSEPPVTPAEFDGTVRRVNLSARATSAEVSADRVVDIPTKLHTLTTLLNRNQIVLAPSVEIAPSTPKAISLLAHPTGADLDVPPIDEPLLRTVLLKIPTGWQGTVAVIDHGPTTDQVIASGLKSSRIPAGGLPILFQPSADFATEHQIEAFLSNSDGLPSQAIVLSTYTAPALPTPTAPKLVKVVRRGSTVDVYFKPGNATLTEGLSLTLSTGAGQQLDLTVPAGQLHAVGSLRGIAAARQAREYMFTVPDVDPTESIDLTLQDANEGKLSGLARRNDLAANVHSITESTLLTSARLP